MHIWELSDGNLWYGFPHQSGPPGGVKVSTHYLLSKTKEVPKCTPDTIDRKSTAEEEAFIRNLLGRCMPGLNGQLLASEACMYTITVDEHL